MSAFFFPVLAYGLDMRQAVVVGLAALNLGCLVPAYCSTMGPISGFRQIATAKFLFGPWTVRAVAVICVLSGMGWSVVNCVVGGQMAAAGLGSGLLAGVVAISVASAVICVCGIDVLMRFQTMVAIPANVAILLLYIAVGGSGAESNLVLETPANLPLGGALSFSAVAFSVSASWGGCASDYYVHFPAALGTWKTLALTFCGIAIPSNFAAVAGIMAGSVAARNNQWNQAYEEFGIGGVVITAFSSWGVLGKFPVLALFLSLLSNTIITTYSGSLEFQLVADCFAVVPRYAWSACFSFFVLMISVLGRTQLSGIIGNVVPMLGYWVSIYTVILWEENVIFRGKAMKRFHYREFGILSHALDPPRHNSTGDKKGYVKISQIETLDVGSDAGDFKPTLFYNWAAWDDPTKLTFGFSSTVAFCAGALGSVLGMSQAYFAGPIAQIAGGDLGIWIGAVFAGAVYPGLRFIELVWLGK